jgi:hypothetical protein
VTEVQLPLAQLARIGPYFALQDGSGAGFEPVVSLIGDTAQAAARLGERIDDVAARLGTVQRWIGASILFQGWAARLTSIYAGSAVLAGAVPDLSAARLRFRAPPSGPVDLLATPLLATDPGTGWRLLAGQHLDPLARAIRRQVRIGRYLLRGNLASALAGSLMVLAGQGHGPLDELTGRAWAQPAELRRCGWWRDTPDGLRYARTTCCGFTQLEGGGRCGDCPLSWRRAPASPPRPAAVARNPEADAGDR